MRALCPILPYWKYHVCAGQGLVLLRDRLDSYSAGYKLGSPVPSLFRLMLIYTAKTMRTDAH
jgi:hypothetical protein